MDIADTAGLERRHHDHIRHGEIHLLARAPLAVARRDDRLDETIRRMWSDNLTALPVIENGIPIGILTEREVLAVCALGWDPALPVGCAMSNRVSTLGRAADCREALARILQAHTRHLVLCDDDGRATAVLDERDLLVHGENDFFPFVSEPPPRLDRMPSGLLPPSATLRQALVAMVDADLGCVIVGEAGIPAGVLCQRDVIGLAARGALDAELGVATVMSTTPIILPRAAPVAEIARMMLDRGLRNVLLCRPDGTLDGIVNEHRLLELLGTSNVEFLLREREAARAAGEVVRESLEAREAFYRALVDEAVVSIAAVSVPDGRFVEFNEAACRNLGYTREELAEMSVADVDAVNSPAEVRAAISMMMQRGGASFASRHRRKDGVLRDVEISTHPVTMKGRPHLVSVWRDVTELRFIEGTLLRAQEIARMGTWEIDLVNERITWSAITYELFGMTPGAPITLSDFIDAVHPDDRDQVAAAWQAAVEGAAYDVEHRIVVAGEVRWVRETGIVEKDAEGRSFRGLGVVHDITERKESLEQLEISRSLIDATSDVIVVTNAERQIVTINPAFVRETGYTLAEVRGRNPRLMRSGKLPREFYTLMWEEIERTGTWTGTFINRRKSGEIYEVLNTITTVRNGRGDVQYYVGVGRDISAVRRMEEQLLYVERYDARTGLLNRKSLLEHMAGLIERDGDAGPGLALLCLDVDGLRLINDAMGYATGDRLLTEMAQRLEQASDAGACVARTSGDGFAVLLPGADRDAAWQAGQRIIEAFAPAFDLDGREVAVAIDVGLALSPGDGATGEALLLNAESALAAIKGGGIRMTFYDRAMNEGARDHFEILSALRGAASRGELLVYLQPLIRLSDRRPVAAEALLRWRHPVHGLLPPGRFIPLAEQSGLICDLTLWVFEQVCRLVAEQRAGPAPLPVVSVNLSARDFEMLDLAQSLFAIADRHGLPTAALKLEITETAAFADIKRVMGQIEALSALGFELAIDDFGTGYSNIAQLAHLPAKWLKVDRSLLVPAERSDADRAVLAAVAALGLELGKMLVVEGVETEEQRDLVAGLGFHVAQGFLFAKPMVAESFVAWWRAYRESGVR